ncbi:testin-like [Mytilus californianus]|uniref:testin-like n=1 Tax=Mytilus californianus TaxID=6549 RepID=UPI00224762B0|nr:testin-like [Mytilus californianus]
MAVNIHHGISGDQKKTILHSNLTEEGKPRCLKCDDKCPGLEQHYWRKVCRNCRCSVDDHAIQPSTESNGREPINLLLDSIPRQGTQRDLLERLERLNVDDYDTLSHITDPEHDIVLSRIISENMKSQKFIAMLPKDKQMFAAQLRRRQLQRQLPLHDLHQKFCASLTETELHKFHKFISKRKHKSAGIGRIGDVPKDSQFTCHRCSKVMEPRGITVIADRLGRTTAWHPGCFTCTTCKELLVDMIYFYRNDDIYCERHYADSIYPRCAACDEVIFAREYTQAEKQAWHVQHFCCWFCDAPLAGQRYIANNGNPYCVFCFDRLYSKICHTCGKTITADSPGLSHGEFNWHACPHCFSCNGCGKNLINKQFLLKDGFLFCGQDCKQKNPPKHNDHVSATHFHA